MTTYSETNVQHNTRSYANIYEAGKMFTLLAINQTGSVDELVTLFAERRQASLDRLGSNKNAKFALMETLRELHSNQHTPCNHPEGDTCGTSRMSRSYAFALFEEDSVDFDLKSTIMFAAFSVSGLWPSDATSDQSAADLLVEMTLLNIESQ